MDSRVGGQIPTPRAHHTTVLCDSRLFVFGGADERHVYDELFILELGVNAYLTLQPTVI